MQHNSPPIAPYLIQPRAIMIVAWIIEHQQEIEANPNGQLLVDWGAQQLKVRLTRTEIIRELTPHSQ